MNTIGSRLREERLRLGLSQDEFAAVGGVLRRAQSNYESDDRSPDAKYLSAIAELGVDLLYVLKGLRQAPSAHGEVGGDVDELELVQNYRQLNDAGKAALQAFVESCFRTGAMVAAPTARRAKRLPENRRAALDQRTAENVDRAMAEVERLRAERAAKSAKK
ncbi:transcriptional regulator [Burkholderia pseudomallei]|uniref:helix-turn-helix domain-containing protein n=1 Tax=Burkholderia pseudomallei TaxID=28450 RepID=UPI00061CC3CA|nr:helix-turn-helix domain-containing protein [Burkholderia pseudomallei]CAJ3422010.1 transcriptional regulator [Burkholderia pseudomallei]CAJ9750542.1 transcriptional regulator [Burkholderia pseudomallei]CPG85083.1 transcriptional regulator [Burkholderia pseudomallei]